MSKEDLGPRPAQVPKSKRAIQQLPDLWIAQWLAGDEIKPGERKKLDAEKERRKTLKPDIKLVFIPAAAGMTPEQFRGFQRKVKAIGPTEVHLAGTIASKPYQVFKSLDVPIVVHDGKGTPGQWMVEAIRESTVAIATPKETTVQPYATPGVWHLIGFARNRSMPVRIILPDGKEI